MLTRRRGRCVRARGRPLSGGGVSYAGRGGEHSLRWGVRPVRAGPASCGEAGGRPPSSTHTGKVRGYQAPFLRRWGGNTALYLILPLRRGPSPGARCRRWGSFGTGRYVGRRRVRGIRGPLSWLLQRKQGWGRRLGERPPASILICPRASIVGRSRVVPPMRVGELAVASLGGRDLPSSIKLTPSIWVRAHPPPLLLWGVKCGVGRLGPMPSLRVGGLRNPRPRPLRGRRGFAPAPVCDRGRVHSRLRYGLRPRGRRHRGLCYGLRRHGRRYSGICYSRRRCGR